MLKFKSYTKMLNIKKNRLLYTILLLINILFIILLLIFYVLGQKERKAYLSDFYYNIEKTFQLNW